MKSIFKVLGIILSLSFMACNDISTSDAKEFDEPVTQQQAVAELKGVNNPELIRIEADDVLTLTAEKGNAIGPKIKYMPEWKAFGWFTAEDRIEWDVDVKTAGSYKAELEWSVSDEDAGKEFQLATQDQKLIGTVPPSGSWETFKTMEIGNIPLKAGQQKIVFKSNKYFEKGALLDLRQIKLVLLK